jgi:hypothetical protein
MPVSIAIGVGAAMGASALGAGALLIGAAFVVGAGIGKYTMDGLIPEGGEETGGSNATVREPAVSRKVIYGTARTGGAIVFLDSTGEENKYLHLVVAFAGHAVQRFKRMYFNDEMVWGDTTTTLPNNPFTTTAGSGLVNVLFNGTKYPGDTVTFSGATSVGGLSFNGAVTVANTYANSFDFYTLPATSSATGGGNSVQAIHEGFQQGWQLLVDANFHDGTQTTADADLVSRVTDWTSDHILKDTAYIYLRLKYDEAKNNSVPNISCVIDGKRTYNPVTNSTVFNANPALAIRDYLLDEKYGLNERADSIDQPSLLAAIAKCDELVTLDSGAQEKRYVCNGVLDTAKSRKQNISNILKCMSGQLVYSSEKYFIMPAQYTAPTITVDESMTVGETKVRTKQSRRSLYNGVKGTYVSAEDNWIKADFPAQISSTYASADGDPIYLDIKLPFVTSNTQAQRLAKIALLQSRQQTSVTMPLNLGALRFKAGDNIMVNNAKMGWSSKVFQVVGYELGFGDNGQIGVNVELFENDASIYDWETNDEQPFTPAGEISLYDGSIAIAPTSLSLTSSSFINEDGTSFDQINATWVASADVFVKKYEIEWSVNNVNFVGTTTDSLSFLVPAIIKGTTYYIRVRGVNDLGVKSTWLEGNVAGVGDITVPDVPTGLAVTAGSAELTLSWVNPTDFDFSNVIVQRKTGSGSYAQIASVSGKRGATASFTNGALSSDNTYTYRVASVDFSGNQSAYSSGVAGTPLNPDTERADHDYVYKTAASANPPAKPTATTYDFDTNTFGDLTSTWQQDPPTVTGADGKYWAAAVTITEDGYGGIKTITFSDPFSSYNFDGLVTFTNLSNTLADPSTTNITTIDGGLIKTGLVEADRIKIDNSTIDTATIGGVEALVIKNLGVQTIHVGDNQITVPSFKRDELFSYQDIDNTNYTTVSELQIDVSGAPIQIQSVIRLMAANTNNSLATSGLATFDQRVTYEAFASNNQPIGTTTSGVENLYVQHRVTLPAYHSNLFTPNVNASYIKIRSQLRVTSLGGKDLFLLDSTISSLEVKK